MEGWVDNWMNVSMLDEMKTDQLTNRWLDRNKQMKWMTNDWMDE